MKVDILDEAKAIGSISISGELNGSNLPSLSKTINGLIAQGITHVILDFSEMKFISSIGIGCIVDFSQELKQKNGSLSLICHTPRLLAEFELMHLNDVLGIYSKLDQALEKIN